MLLFISMRTVWASFNIDFKRAREMGEGKGVDLVRERNRAKKKPFYIRKKERIKRFSTQMQPTVLRLIIGTHYSTFDQERFIRRKIFFSLNVFGDAKGILEKLMKNEGNKRKERKIAALHSIFVLVLPAKESFGYELMWKHWHNIWRTEQFMQRGYFYHYKFQGWRTSQNVDISCSVFLLSSLSKAVAFLFWLSCFTL